MKFADLWGFEGAWLSRAASIVFSSRL